MDNCTYLINQFQQNSIILKPYGVELIQLAQNRVHLASSYERGKEFFHSLEGREFLD
jgi:hypothetical protein